MSRLTQFPVNVFTSQHKFDDYAAADMKYGDISAARLKRDFHLTMVSNVVDPYNLKKLTTFDNPQSIFSGAYWESKQSSINKIDCITLMFDELRATALPFSFYGQYRSLINKMLTHLQGNSGNPFIDGQLHLAYKNQIINDTSRSGSCNTIKDTLSHGGRYIDSNQEYMLIDALAFNLSRSVLPKFDAFADRFNGMGITVHDVHATKIDLLNLEKKHNRWYAVVKFSAQDHFGLDESDINNKKFSQFQFFKAWFVLQRYDKFAHRPFMTNMEAIINLEGKIQ